MSKKSVIIVGGGTAGINIASQISNRYRVVLLEKSNHRRYPLKFGIPLLIGYLFRNPNQTYIRRRHFQLTSGRVIPFFESAVLGGASPINGCVHTIGSRVMWDRLLRRFDCGYNEVLDSYFNRFSLDHVINNKIHLRLAHENLIDKAFFTALGHKQISLGDTNFSDTQNCGLVYNTCGKIFRSSVLSFIRDSRLDLRLGQKVERLLVSPDGRVTGVATNQGEFYANHVILSGGVIGTCSLLLREKMYSSSVGFKLRHIDIGHDLQDHTNLRVNVITRQNIGSLNEISNSFLSKVRLMFRHFFGLPSLMVGTGATSAVHLDLNGDGIVDTRIQVVQFTETGRHGSDGKYFGNEPGFSLSITPINPESRGRIRLVHDDVEVEPNYLADDRDVVILKSALNFCLSILRSEPFEDIVRSIVDASLIENDPDAYISRNFFSGHHLIGGAHMAVDSNFGLRGVDGLSICDASILDCYPASNIHSSVVILSDIFSKRFLYI